MSDGMNFFDGYIQSVLRGTFLTKREKQSLAEEMHCHLQETAQAALEQSRTREDGPKQGTDEGAEVSPTPTQLTEDAAAQEAMRSFGAARAVRRQVVRETFGLSPWWFIAGAGLGFVVWVMSWFANMRVGDVIPSTLTPIPTPGWVQFLVRHAPMSTSMWIALTVLCLMMLTTRKRRDRAAVLSVGLFLVLLRALPLPLTVHSGVAAALFSPGSSLMIQPFGVQSLIGYVFVFASALAVYTWTKNRMVSLTMWCVTVGLTVGPFLTNTWQAVLWHRTGNPIFWGIQYPDVYFLVWALLSLLMRVLAVVAFLRVTRWPDERAARVTEPA